MALELFEVHLAGTPQMRLQDDIHMRPYAHIMTVIIVTIKLLYCLDLDGSHARDPLTHAAMDWEAWAEAVVKGSRGSVIFPHTAAEVRIPSIASRLHVFLPWLQECRYVCISTQHTQSMSECISLHLIRRTCSLGAGIHDDRSRVGYLPSSFAEHHF